MGKVASTSILIAIKRSRAISICYRLDEDHVFQAQLLIVLRKLLLGRVVFVFQMGKVASTSILVAIKRHGYGGGKYIPIRKHRILSKYSRLMLYVYARLGLPFKIVCPIREPIARNVSAFFHFYCTLNFLENKNTNLEKLEELFLRDYRPVKSTYIAPASERPPEHEFTLNWFDWHFRPVTGIDVYKEPFPIERKWQIYKRGFFRVLVYRIDMKRSEQTKLVSRFLGIKLDEVGFENTTKDHAKDKYYSRFRESVKLPELYIRRIHDSRFAKHFWSPEELKTAADKWRVTSGS